MKWLIFSLFLVGFSAGAEVVCKDPNSAGGDDVAEAGSPSSACQESVTNASGGAVDRETNIASLLGNILPNFSDSSSGEPPAGKASGAEEEGSLQ